MVKCVQVICEHAQVIFRVLVFEGCVASHCPRNDLPRDIKIAVSHTCIAEVHGVVSCNRNCCSYCPKERTWQGLSDFEQFTILQTLIHKPASYLHEVQDQLFEMTGVWVHAFTICHIIKEQGFTRKRVCRIALQQSEQLRIQFMAEISMYDPEMLVWIDETGSARRNSIWQYGY